MHRLTRHQPDGVRPFGPLAPEVEDFSGLGGPMSPLLLTGAELEELAESLKELVRRDTVIWYYNILQYVKPLAEKLNVDVYLYRNGLVFRHNPSEGNVRSDNRQNYFSDKSFKELTEWLSDRRDGLDMVLKIDPRNLFIEQQTVVTSVDMADQSSGTVMQLLEKTITACRKEKERRDNEKRQAELAANTEVTDISDALSHSSTLDELQDSTITSPPGHGFNTSP